MENEAEMVKVKVDVKSGRTDLVRVYKIVNESDEIVRINLTFEQKSIVDNINVCWVPHEIAYLVNKNSSVAVCRIHKYSVEQEFKNI